MTRRKRHRRSRTDTGDVIKWLIILMVIHATGPASVALLTHLGKGGLP